MADTIQDDFAGTFKTDGSVGMKEARDFLVGREGLDNTSFEGSNAGSISLKQLYDASKAGGITLAGNAAFPTDKYSLGGLRGASYQNNTAPVLELLGPSEFSVDNSEQWVPGTVFGDEPDCYDLSYEMPDYYKSQRKYANGAWETMSLSDRTTHMSLASGPPFGCPALCATDYTRRGSGVRVYDMGGNLPISASTLLSKLNAKFRVHSSSHGLQPDRSQPGVNVNMIWSDALITNGKLKYIKLTGFDSTPLTTNCSAANRFFWIMLGSNGEVYNALLEGSGSKVSGPLLYNRRQWPDGTELWDYNTITGYYHSDWNLTGNGVINIYYHWDEYLDLFRAMHGLASSVTFDPLLAYAKSPVYTIVYYDDDDDD